MTSYDQKQSFRALVVDDDQDIREFVGAVLSASEYEVEFAADGDAALSKANELSPDVVFLDINLPIQDGWLVCAKLKLVQPAPTVILMTGLTRDDLYRFAEYVKADDLLRKPFSADDVLRSLAFVQP